eukprot:PITA_27151
MALRKCRSLIAILALVAFLAGAGINEVAAQSSSVCSSPSVDLTPCLNIITGSSNGVPTGSPSKECCAAMGTATEGGVGCFCQLVTTSNPIGLINRNLVLSIPRLCRIKTQPLDQCEVSIPAPAPAKDLAPSSSSVDSEAKASSSEISPSTDLSPASPPTLPGSSSNHSPTSLPVRPTSGVDVNGASGVYLPSVVGSFAGLVLTSMLL